jgi:hypothetical protein
MTDTQARSGSVPQGNSTTFYPKAESTFLIGTPVVPISGASGTVTPASAIIDNTAHVVGIASGAGVEGNSVPVQYAGPLELSTAQWDAIDDDFDSGPGLATGSVYYLSNTFGKITTTPQAISVQIGIALSPTEMMIQIGEPIG